MATSHDHWREQLGLNGRRPSEFFGSYAEIDRDDDPPPQAHAMRRAWADMGLDGILCLDGIPVIYFKEVEVADEDEARQGQRPLKCCSGKDFQQEVFVPTTTATFHGEARAVGMLLQE